MAGAPWRHWGIVVRRCSDSAKEVSRSQGPLPDLAGVAHWGRVDTSVTDFVVDVLRDRGASAAQDPEAPLSKDGLDSVRRHLRSLGYLP